MAEKKEDKKPAKKVVKKAAKKAVKKAVKAPEVKPVEKIVKKAVAKTATKKVAKKATKKVSAQRKLMTIELNYYSPASETVAVAGSFNSWKPEKGKMAKSKDGVWSIKLELEPGNYEYKLVFDGSSWETDPTAPIIQSELGPNNLLQVG